MLMLDRKVGEMIRMNDDIEVVILHVSKSGTVKVGIKAPMSVGVYREEIYQIKKAESAAPGLQPAWD